MFYLVNKTEKPKIRDNFEAMKHLNPKLDREFMNYLEDYL